MPVYYNKHLLNQGACPLRQCHLLHRNSGGGEIISLFLQLQCAIASTSHITVIES